MIQPYHLGLYGRRVMASLYEREEESLIRAVSSLTPAETEAFALIVKNIGSMSKIETADCNPALSE